MINFYTGCVLSGKTKLLSNFLFLLEGNSFLLVVPDLVYQNGNLLVKSRCEGYKGFSPDLRANSDTDLFEFAKNEIANNRKIQSLFIDEIQFFTKNHIDQLVRLNEELKIFVSCFGLSKNHRDESWETIEYLKGYKNSDQRTICSITTIASLCHYCRELASTNIRSDLNFSADINDFQNENENEKYLPCCACCYKNKRILWEENK